MTYLSELQQLERRTIKTIRTFRIEDNQGNMLADHRDPLGYGKYIYTRFYYYKRKTWKGKMIKNEEEH